MIPPSDENLIGVSFFLDVEENDGSYIDTLPVVGIEWDYASLSPLGVAAEYRVLLDDAFFAGSTAKGVHSPTVAASTVVQSAAGFRGGLFAVNVEFRPGYSYNSADTLRVNKNAWRFGSYELNGDSTIANYVVSSYNGASILTSSVRYNNAGPFNGTILSSWGFYRNFKYESMAISAYLTEESTVGINEVNNNINFSVFPNPSNGVFNVNISAKETNSVKLTVKNIVGQTIL